MTTAPEISCKHCGERIAPLGEKVVLEDTVSKRVDYAHIACHMDFDTDIVERLADLLEGDGSRHDRVIKRAIYEIARLRASRL